MAKKETIRSSRKGVACLALAALIWGVAFVAQSEGGDAVGAYTFNSIRFLLGGAALLPLALYRIGPTRSLLIAGVACGVALAVASNLQQVAITLGAGAAKAGFLTSCYILGVPIAGLFFGRKCPARIWAAVGITLLGLYLLCLSGQEGLALPDLLLLLCSLAFTVQILLIDHFAPGLDGIALSCVEFLVCGVLTLLPSLGLEVVPDPAGMAASLTTADAWIPLLYAGLLSTSVAYTLQVFGQKTVHPTVASLLMSTESVFAALSGWILLGERLSLREFLGCVLIFGAVVLAQLPGRPGREGR